MAFTARSKASMPADRLPTGSGAARPWPFQQTEAGGIAHLEFPPPRADR